MEKALRCERERNARRMTAAKPLHDDAKVGQDPACDERRGARPVRRMALLVALVYGCSLVVVALHVRAYPSFSPIDELQHYDYMLKASRGELVRYGDSIGQTALREEACRGIDAAFRPPPCDSPEFDPRHFQEGGYNTAWSQSPLYYALTGWAARAIVAMGATDNLLTAGRLAGGLWLGTGLMALLALLAEFRIPRAHVVIVTLILVSAPVVLHASATVNPDGALLSAGGTLMLAVLRWERRTLAWWWVALVAFVAVIIEPTTFLAGLVGAVYVIVRTIQRTEATKRPFMHACVSLGVVLGGVATAFVVRILIQGAMTRGKAPIVLPRDAQFANPTFSLDDVVGEVRALVTPFNNPYVPPFLRSAVTTALISMTGWLAFGAAFAAAFFGRVRSRVAALGFAAVTAMLLGGPLFALYRLPSKSFYPMPPRYGLPIVPVLLLLVAFALKKRAALLGGASFALVVTAYTFAQLVRA